jgi:hypothetical protein
MSSIAPSSSAVYKIEPLRQSELAQQPAFSATVATAGKKLM